MAPSVPSLSQYLDRWLRETVRPNLAPSTVANYEFFSNAYINPSLGSKRLDRLTVRDVRTLPVNGEIVATLWFGRQYAVVALDVRDGTIREMQWIMNPDKLRYLRRQLALATSQPRPNTDPTRELT